MVSPIPGTPQVLAQSCGGLHVELIKRDNAIKLPGTSQMRNCIHDVSQGNLFRKVKSIVEAFARPVGSAQFLGRKQDYVTALALALAHEFLSLFVRRNAQKGQRARVRHTLSFNWPVRIAWGR